jgi:non-heme chloroperoxidase
LPPDGGQTSLCDQRGGHQKRAKPDRHEAVDFVGLAFVPDKFQGRDRGELEAGGNRGGIEPMRRTSTQPRKKEKVVHAIETSDGTQLAIKDWGRGEPILFLAGWSLSSAIWAYNMPQLVDAGYRCIAYDRRGHGRSSDPGKGYDYDTLVGDLATVVEELNLKGITVVAHSMAGGEVYRYLRKHGDARIKRVVIIAPIAPFLLRTEDNPHGAPEALLAARKRQIGEDFPKWVDDNADPWVVKETSQGISRWITNILVSTSMKAVLDLYQAYTHTDFREDIKAVKIPVLQIPRGSRRLGACRLRANDRLNDFPLQVRDL